MPAPPIENPTPYTCPNCGAGLYQRADFCPHCGARLELKSAKSLSFIISTVILGLGALVFGGVGLCSATFSVASFQPNEFGTSLLIISVPLLLLGLAGFWACVRALWRRSRE